MEDRPEKIDLVNYYMNADIEEIKTDREKLNSARGENRYRENKTNRRKNLRKMAIKKKLIKTAAISSATFMIAGGIVANVARGVHEDRVGRDYIVEQVNESFDSSKGNYFVDVRSGSVYYKNPASTNPRVATLGEAIDHDFRDITENGYSVSRAYIYLSEKYGKAGKEYLKENYKYIKKDEINDTLKEAYHECSLEELRSKGRGI